ncbi:MAG: DUF721 domain-containing protein [Candidatus Marinimicrobia bacterium]|nr:DUF721 domain-containing protein [Candidatus Neomarinimicrobiota bacterium]
MFTSLGDALQKMLRKYDIDKSIRQNQAMDVWNQIVGKAISIHAIPEKVAFGKLYIRVDSPAWRNELSFRKIEIMKKINKKLQGEMIKEIVLR